MWTYFSEEEVKGLDVGLVGMLDKARGIAGIPFVITSGLRTLGENASAGGVSDSSHLRGYAVDLACATSSERWKMVHSLILVGFNRIGVYTDHHVHVDCDPSLPPDVLWLDGGH